MKTENSLYIIQPYRDLGTWLFDDESRNIIREPFVLGVPQMIDMYLEQKGIQANKFTLIFSNKDIPNADAKLIKERDLNEGAWYSLVGTDKEGWICPAILKYYETAPDKLSIIIQK